MLTYGKFLCYNKENQIGGGKMIDNRLYVCQLSEEMQEWIRTSVEQVLIQEGYNNVERAEILENVMSERLCNIEHVLNMDEMEKLYGRN